jgi:hypothetical protein
LKEIIVDLHLNNNTNYRKSEAKPKNTPIIHETTQEEYVES